MTVDRLRAGLADRYRIERELGAGGMATVYLAHDLKHEREVALKVLRPELAAILGTERFLAEIKITARLDHPHILTLIDSGVADGYLYYVLPLVRGESLRDKLTRERQLDLDESITIIRQVASALDYAHRKGVIHRDIKPENILLQEGEAVLADFGIALAVKEAGGNRLTETGLSLGTPQYMSPEQATGDRQLDARSDLYSLAAVLYEMLTGEPPVTGASAQAMIAKLMTERPTRVRTVRDTVPEGVDNAIARALSKVPADRFPGATAFATALTEGMAERTAPAVPSSTWSPRTVLLVVAAAVVGAVLTGWIVSRTRTAVAPPSPFASATPRQLTSTGESSWGRLSPDGSLVAVSERRCDGDNCREDLVIREISGEGVATIYSRPGIASFAICWSPDSRYVVMAAYDLAQNRFAGVYLIPQRGGTPRLLTSDASLVGGFVAPDTLVLAAWEGTPHWLRRLVASTGEVVDSIELPVGEVLDELMPSPDGRFLLVSHEPLGGRGSQVLVLDRKGNVLDSLSADSWASWGGTPGEVILTRYPFVGSLMLVRRRLDARGRFLKGADTLASLLDPGFLAGISPDGRTMVYTARRAGETAAWTATRSDAKGRFMRGRRIAASTAQLRVRISPGGRWITRYQRLGSADSRVQLTLEPFAGGSPINLVTVPVQYDFGFSPADDSVAVFTSVGTGQVELSIYALPSGRPTRLFTTRGTIEDAEWLSDGRLTMPGGDLRSIVVFRRDGSEQRISIPDTIGRIIETGRSPTRPALAITTRALMNGQDVGFIHRLDLETGELAPVTHVSGLGAGTWWTTDDWIHVRIFQPRTGKTVLYRVPAAGGTLEAEPPIDFEPDAEVVSMSHDGRRAVVEAQKVTEDLWVLQAPGAP